MNTMKIDITKQYKTLDGRDVKIYTTEHGGAYPVVGSVGGRVYVWAVNGYSPNSDDYDLIEVKPEQVVWVTVDVHGDVSAWHNKGDAEEFGASCCGTIYCVTLTDDMVVE